MENSGKIICITGATGMLGRELTSQLLDTGATIRLIVRNRAKVGELKGVEVVECSLENPIELAEAFSGADVVFNCAAKVSFKFDEFEEIVRINTSIARHVVDASIKSNVGRLVHVSSIAALGSPENGGEIDETCFPETINRLNGYSISKYYSENEVWRGAKSGLKTVIVNPSVILGCGDWKGEGSAALFATYASGIPFYTEGVTGYVDVRDVARAMIMLAGREDAIGRRFILSAVNLSFKDIITKIALAVGKNPPRIKAGRRMLNFAGFFSRRLTPGIIASSLSVSYYNNSAIKELGFKFTPIDQTISYIAQKYADYNLHSRDKRSGL